MTWKSWDTSLRTTISWVKKGGKWGLFHYKTDSLLLPFVVSSYSLKHSYNHAYQPDIFYGLQVNLAPTQAYWLDPLYLYQGKLDTLVMPKQPMADIVVAVEEGGDAKFGKVLLRYNPEAYPKFYWGKKLWTDKDWSYLLAKDGKIVLSPGDKIQFYSNIPYLGLVQKAGKYGLLSLKAGGLIAPAIYDAVIRYEAHPDFFEVKKAKKSGLLSLKTGRMIVPATYDWIGLDGPGEKRILLKQITPKGEWMTVVDLPSEKVVVRQFFPKSEASNPSLVRSFLIYHEVL